MEEPRLRVKAGDLLVIRDFDCGVGQTSETFDGGVVRSAHIRGGKDTQATTVFRAMPFEFASQLLEPGNLHKRAKQIHAIRAVELAAKMIEQLFPCGVRNQTRAM